MQDNYYGLGQRLGVNEVALNRTGGNGSVTKTYIKSGKSVGYDPLLDGMRTYYSDDPTPERIAALLRDADNGELGAAMALAEELEGKDLRLQAVARTRRAALTALPWEIVPAEKPPQGMEQAAKDMADYTREVLRGMRTFPMTLKHLSHAIGPGLSVSEIVWDRFEPIATNDIPAHRYLSDPDVSQAIRIDIPQTFEGVEAKPGKFILATPHSRAGYVFNVTPFRASVWLYMVKHFAKADWSAFAEVFGMPVRVATTEAETDIADVKDTVEKMLKQVGSDGWGYFPSGVEVKFLEAQRGTQPYESLIKLVNDEYAIGYLGQTLTTETTGVGSFALGKVHDNVRADIQADDRADEASYIREHLIRPMCRLKFPRLWRSLEQRSRGRKFDAALPMFKRDVIEQRMLDAERLDMDKLKLASDLGLPLDDATRYKLLGVPMPSGTVTAPITSE